MGKALRILNVEDSERDVALLMRHLAARGYDATSGRVETSESMRAALQEEEWDIILCDYSMPHFNALAALDVLRASGLDIPFIIISGTVGEEVAVQAMLTGAHDYLPKGNLTRLVPAIERELHQAENRRSKRQSESALKASEAELRALFAAMHDVILVLDYDGHHLKVAPTNPKHTYSRGTYRIGKTVHEIFPPDVADFILSNIRRSLDEARTLHVEYTLFIDGDDRWFDGTVTPMTDDSVVWVARDISERRRAENERRVVSEIIQGAVSTPNLEEFLKLVHRSIGELVYAENCFVMLHDAATNLDHYEFWVDKYDPVPAPHLAGRGFGSYVLRSGEALLLTEKSEQDILDAGDAEQVGSFSPSWLGVPLRTGSRTIGVLVLQHYEKQDAFSRRDLEFVSSVGDQVALAIERKRAAKDLADSQERYRELVENALDIIYTHDLNGNYTSVNKAAETLTGYTNVEILAMNMAETIPADQLEKAKRMISAKLAGETITAYELDLLAKDGHSIAVEVNTRIIYENGIPVAVQGIARDITDRKRTEAALEESEASFRSLFNTANDAILVVNEGLFLACNPAAERLFGCTTRDIVGRSPAAFSPREQPDGRLSSEKAGEYIEAAMKGEPQFFEWTHNRLDGTLFDAEVSLNLVNFGGATQLQGTVRDISARKLSEEAVQEKAALLEAQVNSTIDGILVVDKAGKQVVQNQQLVDIFKIPQDIADDADDSNQVKWVRGMMKDPEKFMEKVVYLYSHPDEISREEIELKNGTILDRYSAPVLGKDGKNYGRIWTFRDITERKLAVDALRESDEKFHQLADNITDAFWIRSPDMNKIYYISPAYEQIWGRTLQSDYANPHEWYDFIVPVDRQRVKEAYAALMHDAPNIEVEYRIIRADDEIRWVRGRGFQVRDADGNLIRLAGIITDITGRMESAEAMRDSEERFSGAFEFAPIGVALVAPDGHWLKVNRALCDLVGYPESELLESTFQDITHPDDLALDLDHLDRLVDGEISSYQIEKRYIHKLGHLVSVVLNVSLVRDKSGDPRYLISQIQDITERKQLEEQFRQSQKMEAVGVLAGGIAHDFNNLLTAINGYSDLTLRKMLPDDPFRHNIEEVKNAGSRAAELTAQLLAFSRKQVLNPIVVSLNSVILNIEKMLRRIIRESIELRVVLDPALGNVKADPGQIEQVVMNLAINARDAMQTGGTLTIETQNVYLDEDYVSEHIDVAPGEYVRLTVTDTGEGMDENTRPHIFEPFYTTKEVGKGTGLGLSTVYGIVKQSGGDIMVYSELGHGTTFKILLPCVEAAVQRPKWAGDRVQRYAGTETILLVEDEEVVRNLVREILTDNGYKVLEAAGGKDALSICKTYADPIHMLLTDVIMPKMGGSELKDLILKLRPDIYVLFMSGYTDDSIADRGIYDSDIAFIEKPFTPDALSRKVREVLEY